MKSDKLVCIVRASEWKFEDTGKPATGPDKNDIVTFDGFSEDNMAFIQLREYDYICGNGKQVVFPAQAFRPIDSNYGEDVAYKLEKELNRVPLKEKIKKWIKELIITGE